MYALDLVVVVIASIDNCLAPWSFGGNTYSSHLYAYMNTSFFGLQMQHFPCPERGHPPGGGGATGAVLT